MPIVVQPADQPQNAAYAKIQLIAHMLNMEHGQTEYLLAGGNLQKNESPMPWPLYEVPSLTTRGVACHVHYKPACGVIYYSSSDGILGVVELANELALTLDEHTEHLQKARAMSMTASSLLRNTLAGPPSVPAVPAVLGTAVVGPRKPFRKALPVGTARSNRPSRLLLVAPADEHEPPPIYSTRAAFTWVFLPMSAAFSISKMRALDPIIVNALVAGIIFDAHRVLTCPNNSEIMPSFTHIKEPLFNVHQISSHTGEFEKKLGASFRQFNRNYAFQIVVKEGKCHLSYLGDYRSLVPTRYHTHSRRTARRVLNTLQHVRWPENTVAGCLGENRASSCVCCSAPLGGAAILVLSPKYPENAHTYIDKLKDFTGGMPLFHPMAGAPTGALICEYCWIMIEQPVLETFEAFDVKPSRVHVPWTQADAADAMKLDGLSCILRGRVTKVTTGAYRLTRQGQKDIILAGSSLGPCPILDYPEKMANAIVLPDLHILDEGD